jgi:PAS domain S-box-containing protein
MASDSWYQIATQDNLSPLDLRILLDHAPDAIGRFDRQLRHVYVNEATARANNRPARDFIGRTMEDLGHPPETVEIINDNLLEVFRTGEERRFELLFQSPRGPMWFQCRMVPEREENGKIEHVLVISRDNTQQKQAEAALREAEIRSTAARITAELAHEINNPLTAIVNALFLLGRNPSLDADARALLDMASSSLERVTNISRRMLFLYHGSDHLQQR